MKDRLIVRGIYFKNFGSIYMKKSEGSSFQSQNDEDIQNYGYYITVGPKIPIDWAELEKDLPEKFRSDYKPK